MEAGSCLDLLALLGEGDALVGDFLFEILEGRNMLVDDRLVEERPQGFCRLQLWTVGRQINEANAIWDLEAGGAVPTGIVENEQDNASDAGFGLAREGFQQSFEEWL